MDVTCELHNVARRGRSQLLCKTKEVCLTVTLSNMVFCAGAGAGEGAVLAAVLAVVQF